MANKTKEELKHKLAPVVIFAADLQKGDAVRVTANNTVNQAVATHVPRGYVVSSQYATTGKGVVALKGERIVEYKAAATVAANDEVKLAALSGSDQQVTPWVQGTDNENLKLGYALIGAAAAGTATIVEY